MPLIALIFSQPRSAQAAGLHGNLCPFQLEYSVLIIKAYSMDIQQEFLYFKTMTISEDENFLLTFTVLGAEPNTQDWI